MLRQNQGITRQVYIACMARLNQLWIEVNHCKKTPNINKDIANMNLNKVLTHEANMTSIEDNKDRRWPSPS